MFFCRSFLPQKRKEKRKTKTNLLFVAVDQPYMP